MRLSSLARITLALSASISAQLSTSDAHGGSNLSTVLSVASSTVTASSKSINADSTKTETDNKTTASVKQSDETPDKGKTEDSKTNPTSLSKSTSNPTKTKSTSSTQPTTTTSQTSSLNVGGIVSSAISTFYNATKSSVPKLSKHVDTLGDTIGVLSTKVVMAAKHPSFCPAGPANTMYCKQLQNLVSICIDNNSNCTETTARTLLAWPLENGNLCQTAPAGTVVDKLCTAWSIEATRCKNKVKRGPCGYHHVLYLLRNLRDFLGLPKEQISVMVKKDEMHVKDKGKWWKHY